MKPFKEYQHLEGTPMTERDKTEVGSAFWNVGKWNHFVKPYLPKSGWEQILVDMGCNAGVFLNEAEKLGFKAIGVDSDREAIERGVAWKKEHNKNYDLILRDIENSLDSIPACDYIVFANSHYYLKDEDWKKMIKQMKEKTRFCIVITVDRKPREGLAASDPEGIRKDFEGWTEVGSADSSKIKNDPRPRPMYSFLFKSGIQRVPINTIKNGNDQQRDFLKQLDKGRNPYETDYFIRLKDYRKRTGSRQQIWSEEKLVQYMQERVDLYESVKSNGLMYPLEVRKSDDRVVDGNHRHEALRHLGYKTVLIK